MEDKDMFEKEWKQMDAPEAEMKTIRRSIQKRNVRNITISVVLAVAVLLGCVYGIIPAVERLYWNPDETTYGSHTDLETILHVYTELFTPGYNFSGVSYRRSEFASYDLEIQVSSTAQEQTVSATGALKKNILSADQRFINPMNQNYPFTRWRSPNYAPNNLDTEAMRQRLSTLPEYIRLEATIDFPRDLSVEELMEFRSEHYELLITWVAVRCSDPSDRLAPLVGMDPFTGGSVYDGFLFDYRYFDASQISEAAHLEQHFKSRLQYYTDQLENGRGLYRYDTETLNGLLEYVEENGVYTYGCVVTASPATLLALLDSGIVLDIHLVDCWIDIG